MEYIRGKHIIKENNYTTVFFRKVFGMKLCRETIFKRNYIIENDIIKGYYFHYYHVPMGYGYMRVTQYTV